MHDRLRTSALQFGGKTVPAGVQRLRRPQESGGRLFFRPGPPRKCDPDNKNGAVRRHNYTPDKDVVHAPMVVEKLDMSIDQLAWAFIDVTKTGGKLAVVWDTAMGIVPFTVAGQ